MKITFIALIFLLYHGPSYSLSYTEWGDIATVIPSLTLLSKNIVQDKKELYKTQAYSSLTAYGVTSILKNRINATRPNGENENSFPSGHTTMAFLGVYPLFKNYGAKWGVPALVIATSVAHSRVQGDFHYTRDVIAGAAISLLSDYYFYNLNNKNHVFRLSPTTAYYSYLF